jgi:formaldehyde-activating enzyme involved in methanogenesis
VIYSHQLDRTVADVLEYIVAKAVGDATEAGMISADRNEEG